MCPVLQKIKQTMFRLCSGSGRDTALPVSTLSEAPPPAEVNDDMARQKFKPGENFSLDLKKMTFQAQGGGLRYLGWGVVSLVLIRLVLFAVGAFVTISAVPIGCAGISALMKLASL